jgi:ribosome-associated toxin RatA of RatAB toxin-antitoxin module
VLPYVEVSTIVAGVATDIYPILKDMEKYPEFMSDLVSVTVLERQEQSTVTSWVSKVDGRIIKWTERDVFDDENCHIFYSQIDGDMKRFAGEWILTPVELGTEIKLTVDFEFGVPMIAGLLHPLLKRKVKENSMNMLEAIKAHVELL